MASYNCQNRMGLNFGLENPNTIYKRKHRWLFYFNDIASSGIGVLPPAKSARPTLSFKEIEVQHVNETIYYPGKPEWKTLNLALYDIVNPVNGGTHPVMNWLMRLFDPQQAQYNFIINPSPSPQAGQAQQQPVYFKLDATVELYDPCGICIEKWYLDNAWPQQCDFQELDMASVDVLLADMTLRFDRAYIVPCGNNGTGSSGNPNPQTGNGVGQPNNVGQSVPIRGASGQGFFG